MTFEQFCKEQGEWSQATFGSDSVRGPKGPLLHLQKEVVEALAELENDGLLTRGFDMEVIDCFFLVVDAARRSGIGPVRLLELAEEKLRINKARTWQKPVSGDQAIEHVREQPVCTAGQDSWLLHRMRPPMALRICRHTTGAPRDPAREALVGAWISAKERLPDGDEHVLLCYEGVTQNSTAQYRAEIDGFIWSDEELDPIPLSCVSHWQPLPAPPARATKEPPRERRVSRQGLCPAPLCRCCGLRRRDWGLCCSRRKGRGALRRRAHSDGCVA